MHILDFDNYHCYVLCSGRLLLSDFYVVLVCNLSDIILCALQVFETILLSSLHLLLLSFILWFIKMHVHLFFSWQVNSFKIVVFLLLMENAKYDVIIEFLKWLSSSSSGARLNCVFFPFLFQLP